MNQGSLTVSLTIGLKNCSLKHGTNTSLTSKYYPPTPPPSPSTMCDSLPCISADQLTKAVSLAAGGTLAQLDNDEDTWRDGQF